MQTWCRIQATGQNNGDKLRNYTKSSNRSKSPDLFRQQKTDQSPLIYLDSKKFGGI